MLRKLDADSVFFTSAREDVAIDNWLANDSTIELRLVVATGIAADNVESTDVSDDSAVDSRVDRDATSEVRLVVAMGSADDRMESDASRTDLDTEIEFSSPKMLALLTPGVITSEELTPSNTLSVFFQIENSTDTS